MTKETVVKKTAYENVEFEVAGGVLVIRVDLDPRRVSFHASKSGKSSVVGTTGGARRVGNGTVLNLTVYQPR